MGHLNKRQRESAASKGLENKLAKYAVAGGAMLGAPFAAHADIIYSQIINQAVSGTGGSFTVPVLSNFTLATNDSTADGYYVNTVNVSGAKGFVPASTNTNPAALNFGDFISIANATGPGSVTAVPLLQYGTQPMTSPPYGAYTGYKGGNWPQDGGNAYLGMQYACPTPGSLACTAWARINVTVSGSQGVEGATLVDYAYDTTPGESITAGEGTPEPSSLALFALGGAAALALLRRRRKAALTA